jgi:hypothetical protein
MKPKQRTPNYTGAKDKKQLLTLASVPAPEMSYEDKRRMRKQERAIREGVKPTDKDLALLHTLHAETDNAVVAAINNWYSLHGCVKLSQLTYLRGLAATLL